MNCLSSINPGPWSWSWVIRHWSGYGYASICSTSRCFSDSTIGIMNVTATHDARVTIVCRCFITKRRQSDAGSIWRCTANFPTEQQLTRIKYWSILWVSARGTRAGRNTTNRSVSEHDGIQASKMSEWLLLLHYILVIGSIITDHQMWY